MKFSTEIPELRLHFGSPTETKRLLGKFSGEKINGTPFRLACNSSATMPPPHTAGLQQSLQYFPLTLRGEPILALPHHYYLHYETLEAQAKMSDVNTLLIEPLTKFVKDSAYLVKKCTKPDHKGISTHSLPHLSTFISCPHHGKHLTSSNQCFIANQRICQDRKSHWIRIFDNGICWIFCQTYSHSHQQYYRRGNVR